MKRESVVKVLSVIVIILIIAAIWMFKNNVISNDTIKNDDMEKKERNIEVNEKVQEKELELEEETNIEDIEKMENKNSVKKEIVTTEEVTKEENVEDHAVYANHKVETNDGEIYKEIPLENNEMIINPNESKRIILKQNEEIYQMAKETMTDFEVTDKLDLESLKTYNLPIIIDFGSDGCMPCREMFPGLMQLHDETQGKAVIRFIDVWKYPDLAAAYPINLIPTQMFITKEGTPYIAKNMEGINFEYIKDSEENIILTLHVGMLTKEEMRTILKEMGMNE